MKLTLLDRLTQFARVLQGLVAILQVADVLFEQIAVTTRQVEHSADVERLHPARDRIDLPEGFGHLR